MKKSISLILILTLVLSLAACAKTPAQENEPGEEVEIVPEGPVDEGPSEENSGEENPSEENPSEENPGNPDETESQETEEENDPAVADLLDKLEALVDGVNPEMDVENAEIPEDRYPDQLFIDYVEGARAVTSMAMINAVPHSVCLLQLPEDADAEAVAQEIEDNLDPAKWICAEAEATAVRTSGPYVLLVMSDQESVDTILKNFDEVFSETETAENE